MSGYHLSIVLFFVFRLFLLALRSLLYVVSQVQILVLFCGKILGVMLGF